MQAGDYLYGTTTFGGVVGGYGTVFRVTLTGTLTTLHSFCSQSGCPDGEIPLAGLVQTINGNFYGTTGGGGPNAGGTIFNVTPGGTLTTLYSFCSQSGCTDGRTPEAGLVEDADANFYGTTEVGGANDKGTVFKISSSGTLTTLYSFCSQSGCADGELPAAGLVLAADANLYGTTAEGGAYGLGTVFKITPSGSLSVLYSFCSQRGCPDGQYPTVGLVQATDGDFYGVTSQGGAYGGGTVFKITPGGTLTEIYSFCAQEGCTDGADPEAALVQDTAGALYGTTKVGGNSPCAGNGCGTVFSLDVGLGPFVETRPTTGKVGKSVIILGTDLTGATSVTFNGIVAAAFRVVSKSAISTSVPAGATTGTVQVVTPSRTLSSNVPFRVAP